MRKTRTTASLGKKLRMARRKAFRGVPRVEVASSLGIADSTLGSYESGWRMPDEKMQAKIIEVYDLPSAALFSLTKEA